MARKYRDSLNRRDAKLVGVCSTLGERFGVDPTFIRSSSASIFSAFLSSAISSASVLGGAASISASASPSA